MRSVNAAVEPTPRTRVIAFGPATGEILDAAGREALVIEEPLLGWPD
jgi:hypothetical protein